MATKHIHLHWLWVRGPKMLKDVSKAISLCGMVGLERSQVTSFMDDCDCLRCLQLADKQEESKQP